MIDWLSCTRVEETYTRQKRSLKIFSGGYFFFLFTLLLFSILPHRTHSMLVKLAFCITVNLEIFV